MSQGLSVGRRTARAAVWGFAATASAKAVTLLGLALLARILAPREFGLLAFAMAYITYAETIGDLGSGMALVYWPDRRDEAAQVTFLVNVASGLFWCGLTLLLAPWVAAFFQTPSGAPIVRALAWSFPIKFLGTAHDALAQKDLRFRARALPEFGFSVIKAAVAVVLAYLGFGAWSLVWGHLAGLACSTILLWFIVSWRPSWSWPSDLFKPMLAYGRSIMFVNVLHGVSSDADLAFVGHYLGVTMLGIYQMATRITETGVSIVLRVISRVLFPAFAELHGAGERLRRPFLFATRCVPAITFPAAIGLSVMARPIIRVAFGPKWMAAAPILAILGIYMAIATLANHAGDVLKATGRASLLARWSTVRAALTLIALFIAAHQGVLHIAWSLAIVNTITTTMLLVIAARLIDASAFDIMKAFFPSTVSVALMAGAVLLWQHAGIALRPWPELLAGVSIGAVVYLVSLRLTDPGLFQWAGKSLLNRPANAPPAPAAAGQ